MRIVDSGGTKRTVSGLRIFDGTTKRRVLKVRRVKADLSKEVLATFGTALSASASPTTASSYTGGITNTVTAIPTGGESPFTYSWAITVVPDGATTSITSPTNATTAFAQSTAEGAYNAGQATVTITDSLGSTATASVELTFENEDFS